MEIIKSDGRTANNVSEDEHRKVFRNSSLPPPPTWVNINVRGDSST